MRRSSADGRTRWWRAALLAIACAIHVGGAAAQSSSAGQTTFLFPVLRYGPNNQKRDLRHTLALAKHLGFGVVLTGLWKHYSDLGHKFGLNTPHALPLSGSHQALQDTDSTAEQPCFDGDFLPFDDVLSREPLSHWIPVATVEELRSTHGWDGKLDAVVYTQEWWHLGRRDVDKALAASNVSLVQNVEHISLPHFLGCDPQAVEDLRQRLSKHRVVAVVFVLLGSHERPHMHKEAAAEPQDACLKVQWQANRLLQPASWIDHVAEQYVATHLGATPFVAVHVRPYPDTCLDLWRMGNFNASQLHRKCHKELQDLHLRLVPCVYHLMRTHPNGKLFVMAHPVLRMVITSLLSKAGLDPHLIDVPSIEQLAGCKDNSASFVSLVEEQVAVRAAAFLGTSTSSITQTIAYERMGRNSYENWYFEQHDSC